MRIDQRIIALCRGAAHAFGGEVALQGCYTLLLERRIHMSITVRMRGTLTAPIHSKTSAVNLQAALAICISLLVICVYLVGLHP
jgi:hypothetical protein